MQYDWGIAVYPQQNPLGFRYGDGVLGPVPEIRTLDDIRKSLRVPECQGPEEVYAIAMDVARKRDRDQLQEMMLLFGVVTFAAGKLGDEPIRSQGHIHKVSGHSGWSPPEVYEIWTGKAIIYMQEYAEKNPGRCFAVEAGPGDIVIVPPNWTHATISADPTQPMTFGAWCDREYGFKYTEVRQRGGIAHFPVFDTNDNLIWERNASYESPSLEIKAPNDYSELGIVRGVPLYTQYEQEPERFQWVSKPYLKESAWEGFIP